MQAEMTKEECVKMCQEKGCSEEQTQHCMSHFDSNGNWEGCKENKSCCKSK